MPSVSECLWPFSAADTHSRESGRLLAKRSPAFEYVRAVHLNFYCGDLPILDGPSTLDLISRFLIQIKQHFVVNHFIFSKKGFDGCERPSSEESWLAHGKFTYRPYIERIHLNYRKNCPKPRQKYFAFSAPPFDY